MDISFSTPALVFPAITLLLLTYSNKFSALAKLIRNFYNEEQEHPSAVIEAQLKNFKKRIKFIKIMEASGIFGMILSLISVVSLYFDFQSFGKIVFFASLLSILISLTFALLETISSTEALYISMRECSKNCKK